MQRFKMLNAEDAEEKFAERNKVFNYWALSLDEKVHGKHDGEVDDGEGVKEKPTKNLKVTDIEADNWMDSDESGENDSDEEGGGKKNKHKGAGRKSKKKKSLEDVDIEAFEDSDDGAEEGREVDYMSDDSSDDEEEEEAKHDVKGVEEDEGLAKMLNSDSEDDDENGSRGPSDEDAAAADQDPDQPPRTTDVDAETVKKNLAEVLQQDSSDPPSASTPIVLDSDRGSEKRKALVESIMAGPSKRIRTDVPSVAAVLSPVEQALQDDVRRYLMRKPMTTTELIKKFKGKKSSIAKEELMTILTNILKRLNPHKQKVKGIMYISLKASSSQT